MAIKMISVKCPDCGASLDVEEGRRQCFCSYCGAKVMINNENEYIYRTIDEAGIKKAEVEKEIRLKELELQAAQQKDNNVLNKPLTIIWMIFSIIILVICIWNWTFGGDDGSITGFEMLFWMGGPVIGGGAYLIFKVIPEKSDDKVILSNGGIRIPNLGNLPEQNYATVERALLSAGFTNVSCINMHDVSLGLLQKPDRVESISVNGKNVSSYGKAYMPESKIVITYHGR